MCESGSRQERAWPSGGESRTTEKEKVMSMFLGTLIILGIISLPFIITGSYSDEEFDEEVRRVNLVNDIEDDIQRGFY